MAFTMHTHSGQFCPGHAQDDLEAIVQHAISIGYKTMGLTEHMPRMEIGDLYPEELEPSPAQSLAVLEPRHRAYVDEASRLQAKYASQIHILIGFEGEWYRPSYQPYIQSLASDPRIDYFLGSLHHVLAIPIDYSKELYAQARDAAGGTEESMYESYYDAQHEMLCALRPQVVGHFDLVRLMSEVPGRDVRAWEGVWGRIRRNLRAVVGYGGLLECNSSGLRKGLGEPYPCRVIAEEYLSMGGKFTISDDSHGIAQIATNYRRAVDYLDSLGVKEVWTFERSPHPGVDGDAKAKLTDKSVPLDVFKETFK